MGMKIKKVLSKTKNKLSSSTSAFGKSVVGVGSSVTNTAQSGVGLAANTVQSGVGLAANTAQFGAGLAVNTVQTGVGLGVNTVLKTASGVGNGVLHITDGFRASGGPRIGKINEMDIFCSDLYTVEFVLEEFAKAKKTPVVDTMAIEDLFLRDDERLNKAAVNLVYKTLLPPKCEFDLDDDVPTPSTPYERAWKSMTFCECITNAGDYRLYMEKKKEFQGNLRKVLKKRGVNKMPIKFTAKVEIAMLDMNEMIELLHEIEQDKSIYEVKLPDFCKDIQKFPSALVHCFDEDTLDWKDDADPVVIHIKYGSKPSHKLSKSKRPSLLARKCSLKLEHIVMHSDKCLDVSDDDDDGSYFRAGSSASLPILYNSAA